jgi:ribosome recycling factor
MLDDVIKDLSQSIAKTHDALKRDLAKLRTGRANPAMLDAVRVDYYGTPTQLSQMANISVPEPRLLLVKPWDRGQVKVIEKAIRDADLGLNPQPDGEIVRIPIPPLNEERRKDLVKIAKKCGEECRVAVRKCRHEALDMISLAQKEGDVSEDVADRGKKKVEEVIAESNKTVDSILANKEKDILEI